MLPNASELLGPIEIIWTGKVILAMLEFHISNDGAEMNTQGGRKLRGSVTIGSDVAVASLVPSALMALLNRSV
jgi:hypothetical protein